MNENPIVDLHFINSLEGWAVLQELLDGGAREGGVILHTTDGGDYWKVLDNTNQPAIAIHFADSRSGWVILRNGVSIATHDGGVTWKRVLSDSDSGWPPRRIGRITFQDHQQRGHLEGMADSSSHTTAVKHGKGRTFHSMKVRSTPALQPKRISIGSRSGWRRKENRAIVLTTNPTTTTRQNGIRTSLKSSKQR